MEDDDNKGEKPISLESSGFSFTDLIIALIIIFLGNFTLNNFGCCKKEGPNKSDNILTWILVAIFIVAVIFQVFSV